jgi:hypothetical protein
MTKMPSNYKLRYPIGEFNCPKTISKKQIESWITTIECLPKNINVLTKSLSENELNFQYRPEGWTIKQVVHHLADSHMNSIIRFKLALTEDAPTIRPYFEDRWAKLEDYDHQVDPALSILYGVHAKLVVILKNLSDLELKREFIHPEHGKHFTLDETIGMYAWHSEHHLAHIKQAIKHKGQF